MYVSSVNIMHFPPEDSIFPFIMSILFLLISELHFISAIMFLGSKIRVGVFALDFNVFFDLYFCRASFIYG